MKIINSNILYSQIIIFIQYLKKCYYNIYKFVGLKKQHICSDGYQIHICSHYALKIIIGDYQDTRDFWETLVMVDIIMTCDVTHHCNMQGCQQLTERWELTFSPFFQIKFNKDI